jgi:large subunit ribosomal protein L4
LIVPTLEQKDATGKAAGTVELDEAIFGVQPNIAVMEQVVVAQLAARRAGTQSTKTRAEVRGGGAKPWRQKGTGRARQGSIRSPQWVGGGVALGPKPRSYKQRTPKKMIRLALRSALSDRANDGRIIVLDTWGIDTPSTKEAIKVLEALEVSGHVMVVLQPSDEGPWKSLRNLQDVHVLAAGELNAYDVLVSDYVIFTADTLPADKPKPTAADASETTETSASETPVTVAKAAEAPAGDDTGGEE